jgi:3-hydroxyacyl-[acyl-carrier-protein] dehydratase
MSNTAAAITALDKEELHELILDLVPQASPFRFIDSLLSVDVNGAQGLYKFKEDEFFFKGHFPGNPVTPGVILTETMAQIGLVALGIYHDLLDGKEQQGTTFFTDCKVDFLEVVRPNDTVLVESRLNFYRRGKLQADVQLYIIGNSHEEKVLAASGVLAGFKSS